MYRICIEYVGMEYVRNGYGIGVDKVPNQVWNRYGIGMELVWNWCGIGVEFVWNWCGIGVELVWNLRGIGVEHVQPYKSDSLRIASQLHSAPRRTQSRFWIRFLVLQVAAN